MKMLLIALGLTAFGSVGWDPLQIVALQTKEIRPGEVAFVVVLRWRNVEPVGRRKIRFVIVRTWQPPAIPLPNALRRSG